MSQNRQIEIIVYVERISTFPSLFTGKNKGSTKSNVIRKLPTHLSPRLMYLRIRKASHMTQLQNESFSRHRMRFKQIKGKLMKCISFKHILFY